MTIDQFIINLNKVIINPLIKLMAVAAMLVFVYGLFQYVRKADSDDARTQGQQHMIWGVFGFFVMVSVLGVINIALNTFGLSAPTEVL